MTGVARAAVIGEALAVEGYALAGATVHAAGSPAEAVAAFAALPPATGLLVLTPDAALWLAGELANRPDILTVVMRA